MPEKLFSLLEKNMKKPGLYAFILVAAVLMFLLFPVIDANFLYFNRVDKRIAILDTIAKMDMGAIGANPILNAEYNDILDEIAYQKEGSLSHVLSYENDDNTMRMKFLSGGSLFWILAIACLFFNTFKSTGQKIIASMLMIAFGVFAGFIAQAIPTFSNPVLNYIGFPIVTIALFALAIIPHSAGKSKD